jgi:hypothetical protein
MASASSMTSGGTSVSSDSSLTDVTLAKFVDVSSHDQVAVSRKEIRCIDKVRGVTAADVKQKWRSEQINNQRKFAAGIESSWRQKQIASWSGLMYKKSSSFFRVNTWNRRKFELRPEHNICYVSGIVLYRPVLHYYSSKGDVVIEKNMVILNIRRESNVLLNDRLRVCLSLRIEGRKSRLCLAAEFPREALILAFHVRAMLEPGRFNREDYLDDEGAKTFPDKFLWRLMGQ